MKTTPQPSSWDEPEEPAELDPFLVFIIYLGIIVGVFYLIFKSAGL